MTTSWNQDTAEHTGISPHQIGELQAGVQSLVSAWLLERLQREFALGPHTIHGLTHRERVRANGLRLAVLTGADLQVVEPFAYLHDIRRHNESVDPEHGTRAAELAEKLNNGYFLLEPHRLSLLQEACARHTAGLIRGETTVVTCWDADRLDLGRAGIQPRSELLCTEAAKDSATIAWAFQRSVCR